MGWPTMLGASTSVRLVENAGQWSRPATLFLSEVPTRISGMADMIQTVAERPVELLYPIYLDTDMSMAFAAALAGGIALERETVEHETHESSAVRNLRGNLRLFDLLGAEAGRSVTDAKSGGGESRMIRRHTEASIFIALYDELRRQELVGSVTVPGTVPGDLVVVELGPATAPLRRVVEQLVRLLDLFDPALGAVEERPQPSAPNRAARRSGQGSKPAPPQDQMPSESAGDEWSTRDVYRMLQALKDDLGHSGMTDIVVRREADPGVVLTLDNRFVTPQALELLHTSTFTVVGKVTEVWPTETDMANLYRRSVLSLAPSLTQAMGWTLLGMLGALGSAVDVASLQSSAMEVLGGDPVEPVDDDSEVHISDDFQALLPGLMGPALQILPLAICA